MQPEILILDDPATEAAARLAAASGHVVLTGGSTPRGAYELAAERRPDWTDTELWFTDERAVAPDHEFSNYGMVKAALWTGSRPASCTACRASSAHTPAPPSTRGSTSRPAARASTWC